MAKVPVGWWAQDTPLYLGDGIRYDDSHGRRHRLTLTVDQLTQHMLGVGKSGGGKSRAIRGLLNQHLAAGRGFLLLDCQDLVRETLATIADLALPDLSDRSIETLGDKLIVVDLSCHRYGCPGINFLATPAGSVRYEIVDGLVAALREIWSDAMGARLVDVTTNILLLAAEFRLTLAEIPLLLSNAAIRDALVRRSTNQDVKTYFAFHLAGLRPGDVRVWFESSRNKWAQFTNSPFIKPFVGQQRSTFSLHEAMNSGKIVLVNLSREHLKETRDTIGALLIRTFGQAVLSRENVPPERRFLYLLIIDEFQTYRAFGTICDLIETSRKYGIGLSLFHQSTLQEPFDVRRAVIQTILANVSTKLVIGGVGRADAERLAAEFFTPTGTQIKYQQARFGIPVDRATYWSMGEEMQTCIALLTRQTTRQAMVSFRGQPGNHDPYFLTVPYVADVRPHRAKIDALMRHVARRYYRPLREINREIAERRRWLESLAHDDQATPNPRDFRQ